MKAIKRIRRLKKKLKKTTKKTIGKSLINDDGETENTEKEKARMTEKPDDAANVIQEFEKIIRSNKKNIVWLAYHKGMFRKFTEQEKFSKMISEFGVSKLTNSFNISKAKLIDEFSKMEKTCLLEEKH